MKRFKLLSLAFAVSFLALQLSAADAPKKGADAAKKAARKAAKSESTGQAINENKSTPPERIHVAKGFKVELVYSVPGDKQGSWVNLCLDGKGRMIASDQYGGLYRFPLPPLGQPLDPAKVEKVPADIRAANGLLWAFDALYVMVNDYDTPENSGLFRVTSSHGDDKLDKVELLRSITGRRDHGPHALLLAPDGKSIFAITGNGTKPTEFSSSRVPLHWGEDHLLPRMPDGRGFMRDVLAPGGIVYKVSPDGKKWEVYSNGYRNIFDGAFNRSGELFTYDSDMEYDYNTPWYRPTRICHVVSGSEFGWRNGAGKWPAWYPDSVPPVLDIGPGSPTGMTFGYGAKFPAKYQEALYACDWSWGRLYAVHLKPQGASYTATKEDFLTGAPMPLTDILINPKDGAMYFAIGGRKVQSGLYRITYTGNESTSTAPADDTGAGARAIRQQLEGFHGVQDPNAIKVAWPYLGDNDRFIRWAARVAIEHQPVKTWADKALKEKDAAKQLEALLALTRVTGIDPFHRKPTDPPVDKAMQIKILAALDKLDWKKLTNDQRVELVRTYNVCFNRFGRPDDATVKKILAKLDPQFPSGKRELNAILCESLVYLQSPTIAKKAMALLLTSSSQEEQMEYAKSLRMLKTGWTTELHGDYLNWFLKAANYRGGASFEKFIEFIQTDALASLSAEEKETLKDVLAKKPVKKTPLEALSEALAGKSFVKEWKLDELAMAAERGLKARNFENGRKMFGAVGCFACHRFNNEGGMTGPDLSTAGSRYSPRDFLDQIINPSKEINEQFVPVVLTKLDGEQITGIIVNLSGDSVTVNTDLSNPNQRTGVDRKLVKSMEPSKVSPMPEGLLNVLSQEDIMDLVAYVLSGGNAQNGMFAKGR